MYRQLVPGAMGIAGAAKNEVMPRKYAAAQNFFTGVLRTLAICPQEAAVFGPNAGERAPDWTLAVGCLAANKPVLGLFVVVLGE